MKTLISKSDQSPEVQSSENKMHQIALPLLFCLLSFIFSGFTLLTQENNMKNDESKSKRLDILEKLECGKTVASEEIRASFSDFKIDDPEIPDFYLPEIVQIPEISSFAKVKSFRGPFFYYDYNGKDHVIISDSDIKEIHKRLSISLEELRKNIESFRNSEDFLLIQNELKEWSENFRKDIEKMKEDIVRSGKETRSKSAIDPLM